MPVKPNPMSNYKHKRHAGGTFLGLILGLVIGLAIAIVVAVMKPAWRRWT